MARRAWMLAGVLLAASLVGSPYAAETEIGSIAVQGRAQSTATSDVLLTKGRKYRLVVTGSSQISSGPDSSSYDAAYCFQSTSDQCTQPFPESGAFAIGFKVLGAAESEVAVESFTEFTGSAYPAYSGSHSYTGRFTAPANGYLFLKAWPGSSPDDGVYRGGGFTVTISAEGGDCLEPGAGGDDDRGICDYQADFEVKLNAKPTTQDPSGIKRIEVRSKGVLLFDRRVKVDRWAQARPEGYFTFVLRHAADPSFNGGKPWATRFKMRLVHARVRYSKKDRLLDFDAYIVKHESVANYVSCENTPGSIKLIQRGGTANDSLKMHFAGDRSCFDFTGQGDELQVKIERPVKI